MAGADPLFSWTANWTNTSDRRKEDMIVMVNNATRFTVLAYGKKRNSFKDFKAILLDAIRNTLLAMNINPEVVEEYIQQAGEPVFIANRDRKMTAWLNHQGLDAAFVVGRAVNESAGAMKFNNTLGRVVSRRLVNYGGKSADSFVPAQEIIKALAQRTGQPVFKYKAFELLVSLDLEVYRAIRRVIVPANITFTHLHDLIQTLFNWEDRHLHVFRFTHNSGNLPDVRLVMSEEDREYDPQAILETERRLCEFFPKYKDMVYTYDLGDNWEHTVELVRQIDDHNEESPYLLEAIGKTPPEDVGGVPGYTEFLDIMGDRQHPDHAQMKRWAGYWTPELSAWEAKPRLIPV